LRTNPSKCPIGIVGILAYFSHRLDIDWCTGKAFNEDRLSTGIGLPLVVLVLTGVIPTGLVP
jgi:hypothetical protein